MDEVSAALQDALLATLIGTVLNLEDYYAAMDGEDITYDRRLKLWDARERLGCLTDLFT